MHFQTVYMYKLL